MYGLSSQKHIWVFILVSISFHTWMLIQLPGQPVRYSSQSAPTLNLVLSRAMPPSAVKKIQQSKTDRQSHRPRLIKNKQANQRFMTDHNEQTQPTHSERKSKPSMEKMSENDTANISETEKAVSRIDPEYRNRYLYQIYSLIEANKYYPSAARRRGMQDNVQVSFQLLASGDITNLIITSQHKALRHAAQVAIKKSLPFLKPPEELETPIKIQYAMAFKLNQ